MNTQEQYEHLLISKRHSSQDYGIDTIWLPDVMFDYQKFLAEYGLKKGRCAEFIDTGNGKTIIEMVIAANFVRATNKPVMIITPLAVAFQFIKEAEKFGIDDVEYSKDGRFTKKIIICNYERLHLFNPADFDCVLLDESSILKNFEGAIKNAITSFLKRIKYRYLFTATPSPNDYPELGTSSEALGYTGYMDMLARFFKNNQNNVAKISQISKARQGEEWYLKPHAEKDFWQWVRSWSISMRKPSDIGFSDARHVLPDLITVDTIVRNKKPPAVGGQSSMFALPATNFNEIKAEVKATINERCEKAVEKASAHSTSVYWVNLNDESDLLKQLDKTAVEVRGNMDIDEKEEVLMAFSEGQISKLITKTSITAFGLNWQHCNHTVYFPTHSYERWYQAIRRFWRFGQKNSVTADRILSDGQSRILESLIIKEQKAVKMFENLIAATKADFLIDRKEFSKPVRLPSFLKSA